MSEFWNTIIFIIVTVTLVYLGALSLSTDITIFWFWPIIGYSPWLLIPIIIGSSTLLYRMNYTDNVLDFLERDSTKDKFKDAVIQYQAYGLFYKLSYFLILLAGCLLTVSSYVAFYYGLIFMIWGVSGIIAAQSLERFDFDRGRSLWK